MIIKFILKFVRNVSILFVAWIAIMAIVMRFSDVAPAAFVIKPDPQMLRNLPEAALLGTNAFGMIIKSDQPHFARDIYQAGAWLVLPAGLVGCFPIPDPVS